MAESKSKKEKCSHCDKKNEFANPAVWGPAAKTFLTCVVMTYPVRPTPSNKEDMITFLNAFGTILPCKNCRAHYHEFIALKGNDLETATHSGASFKKWMEKLSDNACWGELM